MSEHRANDVPHDNRFVVVPRRGDLEFRAAIRHRFPELAPELDEDEGIHLAMAVLGRRIMERVHVDDVSGAAAVTAFLDGVLAWPDRDPEIENAVAVSFVEAASLHATKAGTIVWDGMAARVRELILGTTGHE